MQNNRLEMYRYARKRIKQKKQVYLHFAVFVIISLFIHLINSIFDIDADDNWFVWLTTGWGIVFILQYCKIFVTKHRINKKREREHTETLIPISNNK